MGHKSFLYRLNCPPSFLRICVISAANLRYQRHASWRRSTCLLIKANSLESPRFTSEKTAPGRQGCSCRRRTARLKEGQLYGVLGLRRLNSSMNIVLLLTLVVSQFLLGVVSGKYNSTNVSDDITYSMHE